MTYSQLLVTDNNDDNSHKQTQYYCLNDVHDIMMQTNDQNADPRDYQNHALSGIGTFTQCKLCHMYFLIIFFHKLVHIATFDISDFR